MNSFFGLLFTIFLNLTIFSQNLSAATTTSTLETTFTEYNQTTESTCDASTDSSKRTLTGHTSWVYSLAVLQNGNLASGDMVGGIKIWNTITGSLIITLTGHSSSVNSLATLPNCYLASGSSDKTIKIWMTITSSTNSTITTTSSTDMISSPSTPKTSTTTSTTSSTPTISTTTSSLTSKTHISSVIYLFLYLFLINVKNKKYFGIWFDLNPVKLRYI